MVLPTAPDLSPARRQVEELMTDTCHIWHDVSGTRDDALDPVTLKLTRPPANNQTVYDATTTGVGGRELEGKCRIRMTTEANPEAIHVAGQLLGPRLYELFLPWDAPVPMRSDLVEITFSLRDPSLTTTTFRVAEVVRTTMLVHRKVLVRDMAQLGLTT